MEISHPRRMLAVSRPDSGLLDLMTALTGSKPSLSGGETVAGTTHVFDIKTNYYTASVPIWLDEVVDATAWSRDFLAPEAKEVLLALGAFVVCFRKPTDDAGMADIKLLLEAVSEVIREGCGYTFDGVCLAVAMPQSTTPFLDTSPDEWEDICQDAGFEFVDFESKGRNQYSETTGVARLKEALESNDWAADDDDLDQELLDEDDADDLGFDFDSTELEKDMFGMKQAIYGGQNRDIDGEEEEGLGDVEVEKLQAMMMRMQAVRDMGADLPEAEKKKFAARAVNEIMKSL